MDKLVQALNDAIKNIVDDTSMPYIDKVKAIQKGVDEANLEEFLAWFDDQDGEDDDVPAKA